LLEAGRVRPVVSATFPLARAADAHRALEAARIVGKIVLEVETNPRQ
jgi:NADPH2:quinone reductase